MTNKEKVAYIRGLAQGLEMDENKKEVKVLNAIIDLLDDMALSLSDMEDNVDDMADQIDAVDEDLGSLEEEFYEPDADDDMDEGGCYYEVTCPNCNETICLSEDIVEDGQMECPNCGETLEFDLDEDDDSCECGCEDCNCDDD